MSALHLLSAYADDSFNGHPQTIRVGQGLIGQCAQDKRRLLVTDISEGAVPIGSALFKALPANVIVLPVLFENQVKAVIELASVNTFTTLQTDVPGAAHDQHRHRSQFDRGHHAD